MSQNKVDLTVLDAHLNYVDRALKNADLALGNLAMENPGLGPNHDELVDLMMLIKSFRKKLDLTIKTKIY